MVTKNRIKQFQPPLDIIKNKTKNTYEGRRNDKYASPKSNQLRLTSLVFSFS